MYRKRLELISNSATRHTRYLVIAFVLFNILINYFWKEQLFKLGNNMILTFQLKQHMFLTVFFYIFTLMIDPATVLVVTIVLLVMVKNKYRAFVSVMFILLNTYFAGLLKAFYADARSFWANKAIQSIGLYCPQQYGNPSGHSWFSTIISFGVIIEYFGLGKRYQYLYLSLSIMIFVPMSRMYLGAHSLNQVLQGLSLGLAMVFFFKFCGLKGQLESYLKNFNSQPKYKWKKIILICHILYISSFIVNQPDTNPYRKIPNLWIQNIRNKCNKQVDTNHLNFMMLMINSLLVNLSTGIGYGFQQLMKHQKGRIYLSGRWLLNQQRYSVFFGNLYFYLVEVSSFVIGALPAIITIHLFGPRHAVMFIFGNIGALMAGYLYTTQNFKHLFKYQIIREETY